MHNPILDYEICEDKLNPGDWRVEYDNDSCETAIFVGQRAEERAREYAAWKSHEIIPISAHQVAGAD